MIAKQTVTSASIVVLLAGAPVAVQAEPEAPVVQLAGEAPGKDRPKTGRFEIGAGFSTDEAFIMTAAIAQPDLFRTGSQLSLTARLSARRQLLLTRFVDPDVLGSDLGLVADLYHDRRALPGFHREASGGSLTLSHPLGDHVRAFVGYRLECVTVEPEPEVSRAERAIAPGPYPLVLATLRVGVTYDSLDSPVLPRRGTSAGVWLESADSRLGSDVALARVHGWLSHHQRLGPFTLHLGGTATAVRGRGASGVPLSERLFLDGSSEVRGFAPGAIGPASGGDVAFTGRGELELPVVRDLALIGFYDVGGIYDRAGRGGLGQSVGFGVLWRSPIGPLRFDWAVPLGGDRTPHFLFSIGSGF